MNTLEALFSDDQKHEGNTARICRRTVKFLDDPGICKADGISSLYDTRSRITHGNLEARSSSEENLQELKRLELIVKHTFRKLVRDNAIQNYETSHTREHFMNSLD